MSTEETEETEEIEETEETEEIEETEETEEIEETEKIEEIEETEKIEEIELVKANVRKRFFWENKPLKWVVIEVKTLKQVIARAKNTLAAIITE